MQTMNWLQQKGKPWRPLFLANPDLQQELALFQQFKLSPDETTVFEGKDSFIENGK